MGESEKVVDVESIYVRKSDRSRVWLGKRQMKASVTRLISLVLIYHRN